MTNKTKIELGFNVANFIIMLATTFLVLSDVDFGIKLLALPIAFVLVNILGFAEGRISAELEKE